MACFSTLSTSVYGEIQTFRWPHVVASRWWCYLRQPRLLIVIKCANTLWWLSLCRSRQRVFLLRDSELSPVWLLPFFSFILLVQLLKSDHSNTNFFTLTSNIMLIFIYLRDCLCQQLQPVVFCIFLYFLVYPCSFRVILNLPFQLRQVCSCVLKLKASYSSRPPYKLRANLILMLTWEYNNAAVQSDIKLQPWFCGVTTSIINY